MGFRDLKNIDLQKSFMLKLLKEIVILLRKICLELQRYFRKYKLTKKRNYVNMLVSDEYSES